MLACECQGVDIVRAVIDLVHHIFNVQTGIAVADVLAQPFGLIANNNHHPAKVQGRQLCEHSVDEAGSPDLYHTFSLVAGEFA